MNNFQLGQLRICTQKPLFIDQQYLDVAFQEKIRNPKVDKPHSILQSLSKNKNTMYNINPRNRAAFMKNKLWKNGSTIHIYFMQDPKNVPRTPTAKLQNLKDENQNTLKLDPLQKEIDNMSITDAIKKILKERIEPIVNLKFEYTNNINESDIRITFNPELGAWSLIGTDSIFQKNQPTMNLGWFDVATTIHEFGHALGMIHEHQNPKGANIDWNEQAVYEWAEETQGWDQQTTFHNIIEKYDETTLNGSKFDPESIMLYFFPGKLTNNNKGTHQNLRISKNDVIYLNTMYKNSPETPEEFYQRAYNESIGPYSSDKENTTPKPIEVGSPGKAVIASPGSKDKMMHIIINIGIIIILFLIIILIYKYM
jgi:hypothetical protein